MDPMDAIWHGHVPQEKGRTFAAAVAPAMRFSLSRVHCCIAASLSGAGWWLCDGSQLCFVGAPYLEEPPNHHEADLMT